ncbi:xanthosine utilization system XapX-like protein [Paraburkholderia sp. MM6662-R1]
MMLIKPIKPNMMSEIRLSTMWVSVCLLVCVCSRGFAPGRAAGHEPGRNRAVRKMLQCSQIISRRASRPAEKPRDALRATARPALHCSNPGWKDAIAAVETPTFILTCFTGPKYPAYSPQRSRNFNDTYLLVRGVVHMLLRVLAALPFVGILVGVSFVNRVEPLVLGMPFVLAWIVMWVVLSAIIMAIIYNLDPSNRHVAADGEEVRP